MGAAGLVQGAETGSGLSVIGLRRALLALAAAGFGSGVVLALMLAESGHVQLRALEATLAAEQSARTGNVVRIGA